MEKKERIKKEYSIKDGRTQKMMTFRVDLDVWEMLQRVANKGRTINDAVRKLMAATSRKEEAEDDDPAWHDVEDTLT